ncbi:Fibroblast growth factor receptor 4 [Lamellibrachia satsuma]|nr:Fibroblast growth factor receptor 4 [Lamellibrachia satsuma]
MLAVMWILVVVIVLLVLFIITRRRQNQPYMPRNLHDFRRTMRQSMFLGGARSVDGPQTGATTVQMKNNLSPSSKLGHNQYTPDEADDDDVYLYGNMVTDSVASWKIPAGNVELVQRLPNAKGRFADIYQATLTVKNGKQEVVAKRLKQRGNANDEILMTAKMNFFATACPKHENILLFVGAVTQGPVLLFELCDLGRLREWLVAQTKVTEDLEDKMITIGLHIARGMKQLHSHEIVHRRLGARNVLLKSAGTDVIIAKIAGFGPMKGEQATLGDNDNEKIPVKWMALEQLSVAPGERRKYDEKTDVWSYGVTLWEIFSKGEVPYSDKSSRQLKAVLDSGYRMPRPTHCQDTMYDQVMKPCWSSSASSRPSFADVVNKIEKLFTGGAAGDEYYYDISKKGQGQAGVEDDGLYQNNIVRKP